jgi:RNA polymerase sigma factor (sigma-70 family)
LKTGGLRAEGTVRLPRRRRSDERLVFEIDLELSNQLRMAARASKQSAESYAAELLARGLEREDLRAQVRGILASLTPREEQVTRLTARGYTNRQIADALVVSIETVKTHVRHALEKLGVRSKTELRLLLLDMDIRWWLREE